MSCLKLFPLLVVVNHLVAFGQADPVARIWNDNSQLEAIRKLENKALQLHLNQFNLRAEDVNDKIVGGTRAGELDAPFQAQLFRKTWLSTRFLCGGSIISSRTILSAGHCVGNFYYGIRYGSNSRLKSQYPELSIKTITLHPRFSLATVQNDLALFHLEKPIQPGVNVRAIELQTAPLAENTTMTLFGFGLTSGVGLKPANDLRKAQMEIVNDGECAEFIQKLEITKTAGMFCARSPGQSACNGDSGGPLLVTETGLQAGVVSFGTRFCPEGSINVYTNISHYIDWIKANMEK